MLETPTAQADRILIVDGLASFRKLLATALQGDGYEVVCAASGAEAQRLVPEYRPGLLLLDPVLPDMSGFDLLRRMRMDPITSKTGVIILAKSANREHVVEAAKLHVRGYLLKAHFSLDDLRARVKEALQRDPAKRIERSAAVAVESESAPPKPDITPKTREEVLTRVRRQMELKAVPPVLQHVLSVANNSESSLGDMVDVVRQDLALAVRVLKLANSSLFGRGKPVQNLAAATQRIGFTGVRNVVASILTVEHFSSVPEGGINAQRFWEHSLAVGLLAELTAGLWDSKDHEHLFLAGLLHDIGRIVLSNTYPQEYAATIAAARKRHVEVSVCEHEMFGVTHAELTRELLREWRTPQVVREAAWPHELPVERAVKSTPDARNALVVGLADRLSHALLLGDSGNAMLLDYGPHMAALDLSAEQVASIVEQAIERTSDITMFYLSRANEPACDPLGRELGRRVRERPRVAVISRMGGIDPVAVFCRQMGWLDEAHAEVAVLRVSDAKDLQGRLSRLAELETRLPTPPRLLLVCDGARLELPSELAPRARHAPLKLPVHYEALVSALVAT